MSGQAAFLSLLTLDSLGENRFRSTNNEPNPVGRIYGGQPMGQAVVAAQATMPPDRNVTSLQLVFLAGPRPEESLDYTVTALQDGKRVCSRYVLGHQGGRSIVGAFISAHRADGDDAAPPRHERTRLAKAAPEDSILVEKLSPEFRARATPSGMLAMVPHPNIEARIVDPHGLDTKMGTVQLWVRIRHALPDSTSLHLAALAYLSDWWLAFAGVAGHLDEERDGFYIASLNHSLWIHRPYRADEWMLLEMESPWANHSRGLNRASFFGRDGALVASAAQECLQASRAKLGVPGLK